MAKQPKARRPRGQGSNDNHMVKRLDDLARFEEFQKEILPALQQAIREGKSAEDIYRMAETVAAARAFTIAATETDAAKAMSAVKDILDRRQGKAKERTEVEHKYSKLKDEELDALLLSEAAPDDAVSSH